jgi:hypothetical protein
MTAVHRLFPSESKRRSQLARAEAESFLDGLARSSSARFSGTVLVDGIWDNPNYWYRYTLFRVALGLARGHEVGVLGPHQRPAVSGTFRRFGFDAIEDIGATDRPSRNAYVMADALLRQTRRPSDILAWRLPRNMPAGTFYDILLKAQRGAEIDLESRGLHKLVAGALQTIESAGGIFERTQPDLLVLSHEITEAGAALACEALHRDVPAIVLYGNYGVPRFRKIDSLGALQDLMGAPTGAEIDSLDPASSSLLAARGRRYLDDRISGRTDDLGAQFAFQDRTERATRERIVENFGWDPRKPIVGVYASAWFDFPHCTGMSQFTDFLDWLNVTLAAVGEAHDVNWLFKAHPADDWYGGVTMADLMSRMPQHVAIAPNDWNGAEMMRALDGLVTVHGTAGIEFASAGKPVLLADRGWYHEAGFATWAKTRSEYIASLRRPEWVRPLTRDQANRADIFAGWYFEAPDWQDGLRFPDDSLQARLYPLYARVLRDHAGLFAREVESVAAWWASSHRQYHIWKIAQEMAAHASAVGRNSGLPRSSQAGTSAVV